MGWEVEKEKKDERNEEGRSFTLGDQTTTGPWVVFKKNLRPLTVVICFKIVIGSMDLVTTYVHANWSVFS